MSSTAPTAPPRPTPAGLDDAPVAPAASPAPRSLKRRAMQGSAWTLAGYFGGQALRLASNVILARLLFPEAFGLMALVQVFMQGLQMFSDIGVAPSIVQNARGDDPRFLNTAWTIQVVRGVCLGACAALAAPAFASFMGEPALAILLPVVGLNAVLAGFNSTSLASLNRRLTLGRITVWELASQFVTIAVMVAWALLHPTVWALVGGGLAGTLFRAVTSHALLPGYRNRFGWEPAAAQSLFRFGRWIFLSTALTFFASQLDKLFLGKLLDAERLGIYSIAASFALVGAQLVKGVGGRVGFPALAEIVRERPHALRARLAHMRLALIGAAAAVLVPLIIGGTLVVDLLYDARYADAGWMVRVLAAGGLAAAVPMSAGHVFMALGHTFQIMYLLATQLLLLMAGMWIGHVVAGETGVVWAVAAVPVANYPLLAIALARRGLWQPHIDLPVFALASGLLLVGS